MDLQKEVIALLNSEVYKESKELVAQCHNHDWVANALSHEAPDANTLLHILLSNPAPANEKRARILLRQLIVRWNEE